jgi:hypothetical protein
VAGAFLVPWWHRGAFARALAIPVGLFMAYTALAHYVLPAELPWYAGLAATLAYGLLFTLFAVTCHRLVLLDARSVAAEWRPRWTMRETRFLMWVAGFWLIGFMGLLVLLTIVVNAWGAVAGHDSFPLEWAQQAIKIALLYPFARLCLLFPATAVERDPPPDLRWSWQLTRGNGWRLLIVVGALPWLFSLLVDLVYRSEATTFEWLLVGVLAMALFAVEIAAVSLSYRELTA